MIGISGDELIIDWFAGGGGASTAIEIATGRSPDFAINHNKKALAMHEANHPETVHLHEDVWQVDIDKVVAGRRVGLYWFSPDCRHHSKAKGGTPVLKKIRGVAWVVLKVVGKTKPRIIALENVEEFADWGPLTQKKDKNGQLMHYPDGSPMMVPDKRKIGMTFKRWVTQLRNLGYQVEWRLLSACDYGAPTTRKRLFLIARRDGRKIIWPAPTHGPEGNLFYKPYRTAGEVIDWAIPTQSIFGRKRELKPKTLKRIAKGVDKFVIKSSKPFIINMAHGGKLESVEDPLSTIATEKGGCRAVVSAFLAQNNFDRIGKEIDQPISTITAKGHQQTLVTAHLMRQMGQSIGVSCDNPIGAVTGKQKDSLVTAHIMKLRGSNIGQAANEPLQTISAGGTHHAPITAFLTKYYGTGTAANINQPLDAVTTKDRFGITQCEFLQEPLNELQIERARKIANLLREHGLWDEREFVELSIGNYTFIITDLFMRMLTPRELFRAQGFPETYIIDPLYEGRPLPKTSQVLMCGNSVSPPPAVAVLRANLGISELEVAA